MSNIKKLDTVLAAFKTAILAIFETESSEDSEASIETGRTRAEKRTRSTTGASSTKTSGQSSNYDFILPVNGERVRLRNSMVQDGAVKLYLGESNRFIRVPATDDDRAKLGAPQLRALEANIGDGIGCKFDESSQKWRVVIIPDGANATTSRKSSSTNKGEAKGFDVSDLFGEAASKTESKGQSTGKGKASATSTVDTYCPQCQEETKHKQVAGTSKKGRTVYRVTCKECGDEHAKGTEGQHKQWASFKAEHIDSGKGQSSKGAEYVKSEPSEAQQAREAKREKTARNNRKGRENMSSAARSAMEQADILRGI